MKRKWLLWGGVVVCVAAICCGFAVHRDDDLAELRPYMDSDTIQYLEANQFDALPGVTEWKRETVRVRVVGVNDVDYVKMEEALIRRIDKEKGWYPQKVIHNARFQFPLTYFISRKGPITSAKPSLGKAIMAQNDPRYERRYVIYETMPEAPWEKALHWVRGPI